MLQRLQLLVLLTVQGMVVLQRKEREGTSLEAVFNLWKNFAEVLKEDLVVPMSLMMCKKCFSAFERYYTLAKLIINKMKKALSVLKKRCRTPCNQEGKVGL